MILVFTTNENGKIEFTKEELEELLEKVEADVKKNTSTITVKPQDLKPYPYVQTTPAYKYQVSGTVPLSCTGTDNDQMCCDNMTKSK